MVFKKKNRVMSFIGLKRIFQTEIVLGRKKG